MSVNEEKNLGDASADLKTEQGSRDIVAEARELAPYVQGVADSTGGGKLSRVPELLRLLAAEVERLRGICDVAMKGVGAPIMHDLAQEALRQLRTANPNH